MHRWNPWQTIRAIHQTCVLRGLVLPSLHPCQNNWASNLPSGSYLGPGKTVVQATGQRGNLGGSWGTQPQGGSPLQTITCMGRVATQHSAPSLMWPVTHIVWLVMTPPLNWWFRTKLLQFDYNSSTKLNPFFYTMYILWKEEPVMVYVVCCEP
mgnify:CR=1 FL=1